MFDSVPNTPMKRIITNSLKNFAHEERDEFFAHTLVKAIMQLTTLTMQVTAFDKQFLKVTALNRRLYYQRCFH